MLKQTATFVVVSLLCATLLWNVAAASGRRRPASSSLDVTSQLGLDVHGAESPDEVFQMIKEGGFHWLRIDTWQWKQVQVGPSTFNWTLYDGLFERMQKFGFAVVIGIDSGNPPSWVSPDMSNPESRKAYAIYASAMAERYANYDVMWEFVNEPNLGDYSNNATLYTLLVTEACAAMHEAAPSARCAGPSSAFISRGYKDWAWLQECFEGHLLDTLDVVMLHPYRSDAPETAIPDFVALQELVGQYQPMTSTLPLSSGEWGYATGTNYHGGPNPWLMSVEEHGKVVAREFLTTFMATSGPSIYYEWHDLNEEQMGVVYNTYYPGRKPFPYTPKPAYNSTRTLSQALRGFSFERRVKVFQDGYTTDDDFCLLFLPITSAVQHVRDPMINPQANNSSGLSKTSTPSLAGTTSQAPRVLVLWTTASFEHVVRIPGARGCFDLINWKGDKREDPLCEDSRGIHVNVTDGPTYLVQRAT